MSDQPKTLRQRAREAFIRRQDEDDKVRRPIIDSLVWDAVRASNKLGIESSIDDWKDNHNVNPDAVCAEIDRVDFLYTKDEGLLCKVRRDMGYEPLTSLADLGEMLDRQGIR